MRDVLGPIDEGDRLLLPGLRALLEAPSPRRVLLREALDLFPVNQTSLTVGVQTVIWLEWSLL